VPERAYRTRVVRRRAAAPATAADDIHRFCG
jgi:hypothetical protein